MIALIQKAPAKSLSTGAYHLRQSGVEMSDRARESQTVDGVKVYPIPEWEGMYSVSKCGKVFSWGSWVSNQAGETKKRRKPRWLKPYDNQGYKQVDLGSSPRFSVKVHRLMAAVFLSASSKDLVDHKNRNRSDNRLENLRLADAKGNARNRSTPANNTSGFKGVCWYPRYSKWVAQITLNGKRTCLGYFHSKSDAAKAYRAAADQHYKEFAS